MREKNSGCSTTRLPAGAAGDSEETNKRDGSSTEVTADAKDAWMQSRCVAEEEGYAHSSPTAQGYSRPARIHKAPNGRGPSSELPNGSTHCTPL